MNRLGKLIVAIGILGPIAWSEAGEAPTRLSMLKGMDLRNNICRPGESTDCKVVAFVFLSPDCPISKQYIHDLGEIHRECQSHHVEMYGVISDLAITRARAAEFVEQHKATFPIIFDASLTIARTLRPTHVPQAFLVNPEGMVLYSGRIDDRFTADLKRRDQISDRNLTAAVSALAKGASITPAKTQPVGSPVSESMFQHPENVTFTRDVAPILYVNCTECHRTGKVAPFELVGFEQAAKRAESLAEVVSTRLMPPWKADPSVGHFMGERLLHPDEISLLAAWAKQGAPQGSAEDLPPLPQYPDGWQLGEPDLVLQMVQPYKLPATGPDVNRFFVIPIDIPENKVVVAAEFRPGNPRIVHHAILYLDTSGAARKRDAETPEPGYEGFVAVGLRGGALGFWAPGYTANSPLK